MGEGLRKRARVRVRARDRERDRERERIPSMLHTVSMEPNMGLDLRNHEIMT